MPEMNSGNKSSVAKFVGSLALTLGTGLVAGLFSMNAKAVYGSLKMPAFAPPAWIFAPIWIILYILMGISFFLIIRHGTKTPGVKSAVFYFCLQLFFNLLWSVLFFTLGLYAAALVDIIILLFYIIVTIYKSYKIDKTAAILMLPYLIWVAYAAALNFAIVLLNM